MAITQTSKIQIRSGVLDDLPQLAVGEFGLATDEKRLFIGNEPSVGLLPSTIEVLTNGSELPSPGDDNQVLFNNDGMLATVGSVSANANTVFSYDYLAGNVATNGGRGLLTVNNANITDTLTALNLVVTGNLTGNFSGNSSGTTEFVTFNDSGAGDVSGITFNGNVARTVSYNTIGAAGANGDGASGTWAINTSGYSSTVSTSAQPNITSVGTLTGLTVSGATDLGPVANVIITGGTSGQFLQTNGSGVLTWTTVGAGSLSNGTSSVAIPVADGNINMSVGGVANVFVVTSTGANVTGTLNATGDVVIGGDLTVTGTLTGSVTNANTANFAGNVTVASQPNITSVGTLTSLSVTGNIGAGNVNATGGVFTYVTGDGANLTAIPGSNVIGTVPTATVAASANSVAGANVSGQVANALVAGTVYTASQPNITSVGTLTSLVVSGTTSLGAISNITITGGTTGQVLSTNGSGVLSFSTPSLTPWNPTTTYAVDDLVTSGGVIYKRLIAGTTATNPSTDIINWVSVSGGTSTSSVLNATAGASVGAVGTYAMLSLIGSTTSIITEGSTYAGSGLAFTGFLRENSGTTVNDDSFLAAITRGGTSPSGTWRAMGRVGSTINRDTKTTLFLRIA